MSKSTNLKEFGQYVPTDFASSSHTHAAAAQITSTTINTDTTAVASTLYVITASLVLTLPATPAVNDQIAFTNLSGTTTVIIARNGKLIMGIAEDLVLDLVNTSGTLFYTGETQGWVLL